MKTAISFNEDQVIVKVEGSIYVEDAAVLREELLRLIENKHNKFIINLAQVDFIDSSGLGVLVGIQKRAIERGGGVIIAGATGVVKELFQISRLYKAFEMR
ncbi:MAG: anti-sigma-factor antagonist [Firmicutes bacterium]|nr:anti-sigma-factor antagonist [Bacillota bacterium]